MLWFDVHKCNFHQAILILYIVLIDIHCTVSMARFVMHHPTSLNPDNEPRR